MLIFVATNFSYSVIQLISYSMERRLKLPIGIQTFEKIRKGDYVYVDKTKYLIELIDTGCIYFLARPRRLKNYAKPYPNAVCVGLPLTMQFAKSHIGKRNDFRFRVE